MRKKHTRENIKLLLKCKNLLYFGRLCYIKGSGVDFRLESVYADDKNFWWLVVFDGMINLILVKEVPLWVKEKRKR